MSFRESFPFRPRMRPQEKVSPVERTRQARPSRWPVADVGARQPLQRAFTALAVRRKEHPLQCLDTLWGLRLRPVRWLFYYVLVWCCLNFAGQPQTFIYFQF